MELKEAIRNRRSIRKYLPDKVDKAVIEEILEDAVWAPSGVNLQPWYYVVVSEEDDMTRLKGFLDIVVKKISVKLEERFKNHPEVIKQTKSFMNTLGGAPVCVLVFYQTQQESTMPTQIMSVACSAQNFCLLAHEKGLGTCMIGPDLDQETRGLLNETFAPDKGPLALLITLGYAEKPSNAPVRKPGRWVIR